MTITPTAGRTFTPANWATSQNFTVNAADDGDATDDSATITHTVSQSGGSMEYDGETIGSVSVTVTDPDIPGVSMEGTTTTFSITEGGSASWKFKLDTQPSADVTITPSLPSGASLSITAGSTLTFTSTTWNTFQTITVQATEDDDGENHSFTITHAVAGYGTVTAPDITVGVTDNDTKGVTLSATSGDVDEGSSTTYTLVLDTKPTSNVTITATSGDTSRITVDTNTGMTGLQSGLTFTPSNWNTAQTVTVNALHDDDAADNDVTITHSISGGGYNAVSVGGFTANVDDDDTPEVMFSRTTVPVGRER